MRLLKVLGWNAVSNKKSCISVVTVLIQNYFCYPTWASAAVEVGVGVEVVTNGDILCVTQLIKKIVPLNYVEIYCLISEILLLCVREEVREGQFGGMG